MDSRKARAFCVAFGLLLVVSMVGAAEQPGSFAGLEAGRQAAEESFSWVGPFIGGFFLGPFYVIWAAVADGQPPSASQMGMLTGTDEYKMAYVDGYSKEWKRLRTNNALLGWGSEVAAVFVLYFLLFSIAY